MKQITVYKNRTTTLQISVGYDVSSDTFESEIRDEPSSNGNLIGTWEISFVTDGTDGELVLTFDDELSSLVDKTIGYMDVKRVVDGEPTALFDDFLEVFFKESITE